MGRELLFRGEKILGLASRRISRAILVQGSLSVASDALLDNQILGVGPRVDLSDTGFDADRFADKFSEELRSLSLTHNSDDKRGK